MSKRLRIIFICIVFLGIFLRFYKLGENPPALNWDEVSTGYNAYSILKTGRDEYGTFLPLSFRSFDDYKPPLYIYLTVPFVALFGLNESSVRALSALLGSVTVIFTYYLVREIIPHKNKPQNIEDTHREAFLFRVLSRVSNYGEEVAMASAFFMAISPWHLQFSRAAYEGNIGLSFFVAAVLSFLIGLRKNVYFMVAGLSFVLSMYSYHSFRIITPLTIIILFLLFLRTIYLKNKYFLGMVILFCSLSIPVFISFFVSAGASSRLSMVTVFSGHDTLEKSIRQIEYDQAQNDFIGPIFHNRRIVYLKTMTKNYLDHFNPTFLFMEGDGGRQHHAVDMGMLYLWELPFIIIGFIVCLLLSTRRSTLLLALFLIAPLSAAPTTGTPHPVRAIALIPAFHILTALGTLAFIIFLNQLYNRNIKNIIASIAGLTLLFNISYYFHQYYVHTPIEYGDFWQYGHKELFQTIKQIEGKYDKIIVTYHYDQPYIFYLFYNKIDPASYQKMVQENSSEIGRMNRKIGKYEFHPINWGNDSISPNTLIVGAPNEIPENITPLHEIKFLDGTTAFKLVQT